MPGSTDEVRDEGLVLHQLGRRAEASELLHMYLRLEPRAPDASMVGGGYCALKPTQNFKSHDQGAFHSLPDMDHPDV